MFIFGDIQTHELAQDLCRRFVLCLTHGDKSLPQVTLDSYA